MEIPIFLLSCVVVLEDVLLFFGGSWVRREEKKIEVGCDVENDCEITLRAIRKKNHESDTNPQTPGFRQRKKNAFLYARCEMALAWLEKVVYSMGMPRVKGSLQPRLVILLYIFPGTGGWTSMVTIKASHPVPIKAGAKNFRISQQKRKAWHLELDISEGVLRSQPTQR